MKISEKDRVALIRKGNQLFNEGKIEMAGKIFKSINYIDGLIRIGDYYYKKSQPLKALTYYKEANCKPRIEELSQKMFEVLKMWIKEE
jgi:hypothetical protein